MSAKFKAITLDGKLKTLTRVHAQRFVDAGTHVWQGPRTVREVLSPRKASAVQNCIKFQPDFFFGYNYPDQGDGKLKPELFHYPAYNYPLPYWLLRLYEQKFPQAMALEE